MHGQCATGLNLLWIVAGKICSLLTLKFKYILSRLFDKLILDLILWIQLNALDRLIRTVA